MFSKFSYFLYEDTLFWLVFVGYSAANTEHRKHLSSFFVFHIDVTLSFLNYWWSGDVGAPLQRTKFCDRDYKFHYSVRLIRTPMTVKVVDLWIVVSNNCIYVNFGGWTVDYFRSGAEVAHSCVVVFMTSKQYINSKLYTNWSVLRSSMFDSLFNLLDVCI